MGCGVRGAQSYVSSVNGCFTGEGGCVRSAWGATAPAGSVLTTTLCRVWCQTERLVGKREGGVQSRGFRGDTENGALTLPRVTGQAEVGVGYFLSPV